MNQAVIVSCDIYFYHIGRTTGIEAIAPMVKHVGFGEKFDLPFSSQRFGTVPDPEWLMRRYHRQWQTYDTINLSIGQGNLLINPMQLAVMAARIASGKVIRPRLVSN